MSYLRANLPPAIALVICLLVFGRFVWLYPPPFPDMGMMLSAYFCIEWAYVRNTNSKP